MALTPLQVLVSTEDIVERKDIDSNGRYLLTLTGQDVLARVNRATADGSFEWPTQVAARDPFTDNTNTGYGGMKFMAGIEGNWKAQNGEMDLISSVHRSLTENVQITDTLNGSASIGVMLNSRDVGEYGGIAFHLLDKDNYFYVAYFATTDKIVLARNATGGADVVYATSATMGWDMGVYNYIRVTVRYARVFVDTSSDGITWTRLTWESGSGEIPGTPTIGTSTTYNNWSGKFGVIGKGFSDVDQPPITIDPVPLPDPGPTPPPDPQGDAKYQWMIHEDAGSNPPLAVIYASLEDPYNPVYHALIPPSGVHLSHIYCGHYYPADDSLMLVGYASATPVGPGLPGDPGDVVVHVTGATGGSPVWATVCYHGVGLRATNPITHTVYNARPQSNSGHVHGDGALYIFGLMDNSGQSLFGLLGHAEAGMWAPTGSQMDMSLGSSGNWREHGRSTPPYYSDLIGSITSGSYGYAAAYLSNPSAAYTYQYGIVGNCTKANPIRNWVGRRHKTTQALELMSFDVLGTINGGTQAVNSEHTLDETAPGGTDVVFLWSNTLDRGDYLNVVPWISNSACPIYYYVSGTWYKAGDVVPPGTVHYMRRAGGNSVLWIGQGTISNGNEFSRITSNITDMATYPWIATTGNMWSGDNKIIQSGNLTLMDAWLSY